MTKVGYTEIVNIMTPGAGVLVLERGHISHGLTQEPLPLSHESYIFVRPFIGHHYFINSLSDLCMGVEKKIFKEIMHFHFMTNMAKP